MMAWKKSVFILAFCVSAAVSQPVDAALAKGIALLDEGRTTLDHKSLTVAREFFQRLAQGNENNPAYAYELARVDFYSAESSTLMHDKKSTERELERALSEVEQAIRLDQKMAEYHSLLADIYGRKIGLGGFMAGPRLGPKIVAENKTALALDANHPRVQASLGRQYLFAPKMFGGDIHQAIEHFRRATELDPQDFENFIWLGIANRKQGDAASADKNFKQALALNPRSVFAQHPDAD